MTFFLIILLYHNNGDNMKGMNLKKKKDYKKIKLILVIVLFILTTCFTFNYLNKNIYKYNTKEYIDFYTKVSFDTKSNINLVLDKVFDIYDKLTETGDFRYE